MTGGYCSSLSGPNQSELVVSRFVKERKIKPVRPEALVTDNDDGVGDNPVLNSYALDHLFALHVLIRG